MEYNLDGEYNNGVVVEFNFVAIVVVRYNNYHNYIVSLYLQCEW